MLLPEVWRPIDASSAIFQPLSAGRRADQLIDGRYGENRSGEGRDGPRD